MNKNNDTHDSFHSYQTKNKRDFKTGLRQHKRSVEKENQQKPWFLISFPKKKKGVRCVYLVDGRTKQNPVAPTMTTVLLFCFASPKLGLNKQKKVKGEPSPTNFSYFVLKLRAVVLNKKKRNTHDSFRSYQTKKRKRFQNNPTATQTQR